MSEEADVWSCPECTLANELTAGACAACGTTSPLVIASYEAEEQAAAMSASANSRPSSSSRSKKPTSGRGRGASQESNLSDALSEEIAAELDPWTQAEFEWANVEAIQESMTPKKRK